MAMKINVLAYPCGAENAIEIHSALKDAVNIHLVGGSGKEDHGRFVYKNYIGNIPYITSPTFLETFNVNLENHKIDIILPTHDDVALFLAQNKDNIHSKIAVPGMEQAQICRSKKSTYALFGNEDFCPAVYTRADELKFPAFVKPDNGQGGKGAFIAQDQNHPLLAAALRENCVITEYLPGEELTVDCFTNRHGQLAFIGPRHRNRILGGISVNSSTTPLSEEITRIASTISARLKMRGLWYFQVKQDTTKKYKLLEISLRTAGSMNLYRGLGVNFPLLTVYDWMDYDTEVLVNDYSLEVDRCLFNRYKSTLEYDTVYIDFDDTIVKNGLVNPNIMLFLYHAKNNNKRIKLLTKHAQDLHSTLNKLSIHADLFDEIIHLKQQDEKHQWIKEKMKVIFIDNAFQERSQVKKRLNIPVFDVDAVSTLIDWKE